VNRGDRMNKGADDITRRGFLKGVGGALLASTLPQMFRAGEGVAGTGGAAASGPNILYIHSHDTGRYVQPYGYAVETPNIQRFAEQGVLFRQAFCAAPTCSPSRAAMLTGSYPHTNGMLGLANRGSRMYDYSRHIANVLRENGYVTALSGVQHEVVDDDRGLLGYEYFLDDEPLPGVTDADELAARRAAEFLGKRREQPFFLACGFHVTHRSGPAPQWFNDEASPAGEPRYCRAPAPLPDTAEVRRDFADFRVAANRLDAYMGIVFDALERNGLAENTLVICTTDHGIPFPLMKCNLMDHGMGVMLMVRGPGGFSGGKAVDAMVSHIDVFPTVCELAGISAPGWLQGGKSLVGLVSGEVEAVRDEVFAEVNFHAAVEPMRAVRTARYKYIRRFDGRTRPVLPNCDDSISKQEMLGYGWRERAVQQEYLFDLMFDPNESCNLAGDAAQLETLTEMRSRLVRWMEETGDPLLTGRLVPGAGMMTTLVDEESASGTRVPAEAFIVPESARIR